MSGSRQRYTQQQMINALTQAHGLIAPAAQALHCHRHTVDRYIARYPLVRRAYEEAREAVIDLAESKLIELVEQRDWRAIRYLLSTLGKDRGYVERTEVQQMGGDLEAVRQQLQDDYDKAYGDEDE